MKHIGSCNPRAVAWNLAALCLVQKDGALISPLKFFIVTVWFQHICEVLNEN